MKLYLLWAVIRFVEKYAFKGFGLDRSTSCCEAGCSKKKQKQGTALGIRDKTNSRNMCNVHERLHALSVLAHAVADSERGR